MRTLIATGVNAEGLPRDPKYPGHLRRDGAGWLAFFRDSVTQYSSGVALVTSDAHAGPAAAIGATPAQRPGSAAEPTTHQSDTPKPSWPRVRTPLHSIYDQPDAESVVGPI